MSGSVKMKKWLPFIVVFIALGILLQCFKYHFFYIEQLRIFLFDKGYLLGCLGAPAGFSGIVADFLTQVYRFPLCGPLITAGLLTLIAILTSKVLEKTCGNDSFFILGLLPSILAVSDVLKIGYNHSGLVAEIIMLAFLLLIINIKSEKKRLLVSILSVIAVYWLCGSAALILALSVILWKLVKDPGKAVYYLIPLLLVPLMAWGATAAGLTSGFKTTLLPDNYYTDPGNMPWTRFLFWCCIPVIVPVVALFRNKEWSKSAKTSSLTLQACLVAGAAVFAVNGIDKDLYNFETADTFVRNKEWNRILELYRSKPETHNKIMVSLVDLALAENGNLAEDLFKYGQYDCEALMPGSNPDILTSSVGSELYWSMGMVGLSQRMAFEQDMYAAGIHNPRALQRLIRTNLVFGEYDIAEKYISLMEKCPAYRKWAKNQRQFLNDEAVAADTELNGLRRCLPDTTFLGEVAGLDMDLRKVIDSNPGHTQSIQYLQSIFLLDRDLSSLMAMMNEYYGTEAMTSLPTPVQEAITILADSNNMPDLLVKYPVESSVKKRFRNFKSAMTSGPSSPKALKKSLREKFGDTFWYYAFFMNDGNNE